MSEAPKEASAALDKAIREYSAAVDEEGDMIVTGWVMLACGVRPSHEGNATSYVSEDMDGQPWHAGLGLWAYGYEMMRTSGHE